MSYKSMKAAGINGSFANEFETKFKGRDYYLSAKLMHHKLIDGILISDEEDADEDFKK